MAKPENSASDAFIQSLTMHQSHLRAFILGSLGDYTHCEDVLQQTNLILWEKCGDFRQGSEFLPWALAIARFEILAFFRDSQRDRLVFHPDVAKLMTEAVFPEINQVSERQQALRECIKRLPERRLEVLKLFYVTNVRMKEIARQTGRSVNGVKSLLLRIRKTLRRCIGTHLESQQSQQGGITYES